MTTDFTEIGVGEESPNFNSLVLPRVKMVAGNARPQRCERCEQRRQSSKEFWVRVTSDNPRINSGISLSEARGETAKLLPGSKNKSEVLVSSGAFVKSSSLEPGGNVWPR